jgi:DNA-binding transcriptional MerR regulator/uncharacterized glyoxalase superfamily protein PhnB
VTDIELQLRVGDLAVAAGVTVRTIHHYEEIGLIEPAPRSNGGHRLYGPDAVERLYRISLLRRVGLSLHEIGDALDRPGRTLAHTLQRHAGVLDAEIARLGAVRGRVMAALADLVDDVDPTRRLLEVLSEMEHLENTMRRRISILVCRDPAFYQDWLVEVFGLTPGDVTQDPEGRAVHAELFAGDGVVWLHPETDAFGLASPRTVGSATATMAVMVDDVDEHHRQVAARGGEIVYAPVDQPYGFREYGARDCEGTLWSFMKELEP